tara:strand:+ start:2403 stop:3758 length:1356 start_codon:yes stop_codon:yes gene_type:complete
MANTYLTRTISSNGNARTWTYSFWVKRAKLGSWMNTHNLGGTGNRDYGAFDSSDRLEVAHTDSGYQYRFITNRKFRDVSAWYNIVIAMDTTQATESNRTKIYVNGVQETSFNTATYPSQNHNTRGSQDKIMIGADFDPSNYFDGSISHVNFIDGTAYDASYFGSTDSTTGEWKINTAPNVTYGTNGCFILKDGNSVTDASTNSNNFTVGGGTLTKTEDCPSNLFCTLNPLQEPIPAQAVEYSFGNTKFAGNSSDWQRIYGTIGAKTGKYFYEFKCLNDDGTAGHLRLGWDSIDSINPNNTNYYSGLTLDREGKLRGGENGHGGYSPNAVQMSAAYSGGNFSFTANDILGMAIDIDNNTFSVYKNGNLEINAYSYASASNCSILKSKDHFVAPSVNFYSSSGNANRSCFNFGNGYFETTAVSSAGTNASGVGIFEYNVPANYTAFSTKGFNL